MLTLSSGCLLSLRQIIVQLDHTFNVLSSMPMTIDVLGAVNSTLDVRVEMLKDYHARSNFGIKRLL